MANPAFQMVLVTAPDLEGARTLAHTLLQEKHCACVNLIPQILSLYHWQGEIHQDSEILMLIKTTTEKYAALEQRILELHPYDTPEVIALDIKEGQEKYLRWIAESTR
ncbi:divalent-cation tolerance protein CutA [Deinococcus cellulosilyticus]|uniref:Divalent-cation tolerance protein CutA n=1 Tax=Deinococcus cellulosilyticus (strain DSM 18568 / NBRC 106333 / KACC 11606 / 5516J-15) TaxID=1223518 RepID=A0A511N0X7_DEIC1|nr:divalent-cation tolerance protein CutA [Deinococcus cellulosilyticus]GEM46525.1 divalent-cation tolerance protein CutA [Deinococcus cellulosilyticus NBRC 106333 = KACC 11606]